MKPASLRFAAGLGAFALILTTEIAAVQYYRISNRRAEVRWRQAARELERAGQQRPAPTEATARALTANVAELRRTAATLESALAGSASTEPPVPAGAADLFFAIGAMVEDLRTRAGRLNIELARDAAAFGFAAYIRQGPEPVRAAAVRRQVGIARRVCDALLAAQPQMMVAAQRDAPPTDAEWQVRRAPAKGGEQPLRSAGRIPARDGADYFVIDPRWSLFARGVADTMAFRVVFAGNTEVLHRFMQEIALAPSLVIRTVEAEPAVPVRAEDSAARDDPPPSMILREKAPTPKPVVPAARHDSQFTVVVEHIDIVPAPAGGQRIPGT